MDKKSYRVRNWKNYNEALVKRGSITFWINEDCLKRWKSEGSECRRGRPEKYSDTAIETGLTIKALFQLPYRATEGFLRSLFRVLKIETEVPDYSLLCKRQKTLKVSLPKRSLKVGEKLHLALDTTGLKVYGEGEWKVKQHGFVKHRLWRKLHIAMNTENQQIEAFELTHLGIQDCEGASLLLKQMEEPIDSLRGDGAYDRLRCYEEAEERGFRLITPPQRNAALSKGRRNKPEASAGAIKKRDKEVEKIRALGRKEWKIQSDYHKRSLSETTMFRIKTILNNRLSSRTLAHQKVEVAIWCKMINQMTLLGMPESVAID